MRRVGQFEALLDSFEAMLQAIQPSVYSGTPLIDRPNTDLDILNI
jgi:hypothetical protein